MDGALERYDRDVKVEFRLLVRTVDDGLDPTEAHVLLDNLNFRHICLVDSETQRVRISISGDHNYLPEIRSRGSHGPISEDCRDRNASVDWCFGGARWGPRDFSDRCY